MSKIQRYDVDGCGNHVECRDGEFVYWWDVRDDYHPLLRASRQIIKDTPYNTGMAEREDLIERIDELLNEEK